MKLEQQVCGLELAKRLKELGVKQESYFKWQFSFNGGDSKIWNVFPFWHSEINGSPKVTAAFTVAELGEMLKDCKHDLPSHIRDGQWEQDAYFPDVSLPADTEADARAKMLVYLLENKLISR